MFREFSELLWHYPFHVGSPCMHYSSRARNPYSSSTPIYYRLVTQALAFIMLLWSLRPKKKRCLVSLPSKILKSANIA